MAFTQVADDKRGISETSRDDGDGYAYHLIGSVRLYIGTGDPNGVITAPIGSLCIRVDNGELNANNDAGTTWEKISAQ